MKAARTRALNAKHAGTKKHAGTAKHSPSATKKAATAHKQVARRTAAQTRAARLRALGCMADCSALAVATSLRLSGGLVTAQDVLDLYRHTADSPGAGASIWGTLEAALKFGVAGIKPVWFAPVGEPRERAAVILGLDLPEGPHSVCLDPSGDVWSWGGLYELTSEALIEEAWAVVWP